MFVLLNQYGTAVAISFVTPDASVKCSNLEHVCQVQSIPVAQMAKDAFGYVTAEDVRECTALHCKTERGVQSWRALGESFCLEEDIALLGIVLRFRHRRCDCAQKKSFKCRPNQ